MKGHLTAKDSCLERPLACATSPGRWAANPRRHVCGLGEAHGRVRLAIGDGAEACRGSPREGARQAGRLARRLEALAGRRGSSEVELSLQANLDRKSVV